MNITNAVQTQFNGLPLVFSGVKHSVENRTRMQSDTLTGTVQFSTSQSGEYASVPVSIQFSITQFGTDTSNIVSIHDNFTVSNLEVNKVVHTITDEPQVWLRTSRHPRTFEQTVLWRLGDAIMYVNQLFSGELDD